MDPNLLHIMCSNISIKFGAEDLQCADLYKTYSFCSCISL